MDSFVARGSDSIGTIKVYSPVLDAVVHGEKFTWAGHPWQPLSATDPAGITATSLYPLDGDGVIDAAGSTSITLDASGVPTTVDLSGWCVCITSGTGIGQVRQLKAYNTSTRAATVDTWGTTPSAGDTYIVGYECFGRGQVTVTVEFEASTDTCVVHPVFFGFPKNVPTSGGNNGRLGMDGGTGRAPRRGLGRPLNFVAVNYQVGIQQSGFFHGETVLTEDARGATLCKLWLRTAPPSSHKVALYLGAT